MSVNQLDKKEGDVVFREWEPMNHLIEKIPPKYYDGFAPKALNLTCVTSSCHSIILGSNAGMIFWWHRSSETASRKLIDGRLIKISSLALSLSQFGEALAVGNSHGVIAVFLSNSQQHFPICTLPDEHGNSITSLAWDANGTYLLSGDDKGIVLLSKFQNSSLQPIKFIMNDTTAVVQLRFHPLRQNTNILISTLQRTVIANMDSKGNVVLVQVGRKDRKSLEPFGADYCCVKNETFIYTSRPGLRMWISESDQGIVQRTLMFKDFLKKCRSKLILLSFQEEYENSEPQFGSLHLLSNGLVVTYSSSSFFLLNTRFNSDSNSDQVSIVNYCRFGQNRLVSLSVFHNEIFLLVDRTLIRVSDQPDPYRLSRPPSLVERQLVASWKNKIAVEISKSVQPNLKSTISKFTKKILDGEGSKSKAIFDQQSRTFGLDTLSNALAPIFGSKNSLPLNPPSYKELKTLNESPTPFVPIPELDSSLAFCQNLAYDSLETEQILSVPDHCLPTESDSTTTSLVTVGLLAEDVATVPKGSEIQTSPDASKNELVEEDLVYASYIGKKRKLKLTRDSKPSTPTPLAATSTSNSIDGALPWNLDANQTEQTEQTQPHADTTYTDFLEDLKKKDLLVARILCLDQVDSKSSSETVANEVRQLGDSDCTSISTLESDATIGPRHGDMEDGTIEDNTTQQDVMKLDAVEHYAACVQEDIYTKYAEDETDKSAINETITNGVSVPDSSITKSELSPVPVCLNSVTSAVTCCLWRSCYPPETQKVTHMVACCHYIAIVDADSCVHYLSTELSALQLWKRVDFKAHQICVSKCGQHLWRLYKGSVYHGSGVNPSYPGASSWVPVASYIASIGIVQLISRSSNHFYLWMLHSNGTRIIVYAITSTERTSSVQSPGCVTAMCCNGDRVIVVSNHGKLYQRLNVDRKAPQGITWQRIQTPDQLIGATLSPSGQIWVWNRSRVLHFFDTTFKMWFRLVVTCQPQSKNDFWMTPFSFFNRKTPEFWLVEAQSRTYLAFSNSTTLLTNDCIRGFCWSEMMTSISPSISQRLQTPWSWRILNCSAVYQSIGVIWMVDRHSGLNCFYDGQLEQISLPTENEIIGLAVAPQCLWLLTNLGEIFVRAGQLNPVGSGWVELSTLQFSPRNQLVHVSLASETAWACDVYGQVHFRLGNNGPPTLLSPAWSQVDGDCICFQKIYTGTSGLMVWALDKEMNIYVRTGIRPDFLIGLGWVQVPGILASQLTLSELSVWALSPAGNIHRRCGISQSNIVGEMWEEIPGFFSSISVTLDDVLWAVEMDGSISKLNIASPVTALSYPTSDNEGLKDAEDLVSNSEGLTGIEDDWVML